MAVGIIRDSIVGCIDYELGGLALSCIDADSCEYIVFGIRISFEKGVEKKGTLESS